MKNTLALLLIFLVPYISYGQADSIRSKCKTTTITRHPSIYFGIQAPDFKKLNDLFQNQNYPVLPSICPSLGFGGIKFRNKLVTGISLIGYRLTNKKDSLTSSVKTLAEEFSIGYCYLKREKILIYSMCGLNYTQTCIKVSRNVPTSTTFNSYISAKGNQLQITRQMFSADIATHFAYVITKKKKYNRNAIGLRAGYNIPLLRDDWKMNDMKLKDGLKINPVGFYALFMISFAM